MKSEWMLGVAAVVCGLASAWWSSGFHARDRGKSGQVIEGSDSPPPVSRSINSDLFNPENLTGFVDLVPKMEEGANDAPPGPVPVPGLGEFPLNQAEPATALQIGLAALALQDPEAALLAAVKASGDHREFCQRCWIQLAHKDRVRAWELLEVNGPHQEEWDDKAKLIRKIWVDADVPAAAGDLALLSPVVRNRYPEIVHGLFQRWPIDDLASGIRWFHSIDPEPEPIKIANSPFVSSSPNTYWSQRTLHLPRGRRPSTSALMEAAGMDEPGLWLDQFHDPEERRLGARLLLEGGIKKNYLKVIKALPEEDRLASVGEFIRCHAHEIPDQSYLPIVESFPEIHRAAAALVFLGNASPRDDIVSLLDRGYVDAKTVFSSEHDSLHPDLVNRLPRREMLSAVSSKRFPERDFVDFMHWEKRIQSPEVRALSIRLLLEHWSPEQFTNEVSAWMDDLSEGDLRDAALMGKARALEMHQPMEAFAAASAIENPDQRQENQRRVLAKWLALDTEAEAAAKMVVETDLAPGDRELFLKKINSLPQR